MCADKSDYAVVFPNQFPQLFLVGDAWNRVPSMPTSDRARRCCLLDVHVSPFLHCGLDVVDGLLDLFRRNAAVLEPLLERLEQASNSLNPAHVLVNLLQKSLHVLVVDFEKSVDCVQCQFLQNPVHHTYLHLHPPVVFCLPIQQLEMLPDR